MFKYNNNMSPLAWILLNFVAIFVLRMIAPTSVFEIAVSIGAFANAIKLFWDVDLSILEKILNIGLILYAPLSFIAVLLMLISTW